MTAAGSEQGGRGSDGQIIDLHVHYYTHAYLDAVESAPSTRVYRREHDGRFVCSWRSGIALTVPQPHPGVAQRLELMVQSARNLADFLDKTRRT